MKEHVRHSVQYEPPTLPELTREAQFAALLHALYELGYDDHLAGHVTWWQEDGTALVNPFELMWDEVTAADICRMDKDGFKIDGRYNVTGAIELHCAIKQARPDVTFVIHDHPKWSMVWANCQRVPPVYDQTSAQVSTELVVINEFSGTVNSASVSQGIVDELGSAEWGLLSNHGVLLTAPTIEIAYLRAATLEWRCRRAWEVELLGGGMTVDADVARSFGEFFEPNVAGMWWESVLRRQLRRQPQLINQN